MEEIITNILDRHRKDDAATSRYRKKIYASLFLMAEQPIIISEKSFLLLCEIFISKIMNGSIDCPQLLAKLAFRTNTIGLSKKSLLYHLPLLK